MPNAEDYQENIKDHLPNGLAWNRERGSNIDRLAGALAIELARVDTRVADLLRESYPLLCAELLPDWERVTGLPEKCVGAETSFDARRRAVHEKLGRLGGASPQYFIDTALKYGFVVTITEFRPPLADYALAGDAAYDPIWRYAFQINAPETTITEAKADSAVAGDRVRYWGNEILECIINRLKPAHTHAIFSYGA